jgi:serine/threonine protein kinase
VPPPCPATAKAAFLERQTREAKAIFHRLSSKLGKDGRCYPFHQTYDDALSILTGNALRMKDATSIERCQPHALFENLPEPPECVLTIKREKRLGHGAYGLVNLIDVGYLNAAILAVVKSFQQQHASSKNREAFHSQVFSAFNQNRFLMYQPKSYLKPFEFEDVNDPQFGKNYNSVLIFRDIGADFANLRQFVETRIHYQEENMKNKDIINIYTNTNIYCLTNMKKIVKAIAKMVFIMIHGGVSHRDLKPDNILVHETENSKVCIIDFGAAAFFGKFAGPPICGMKASEFFGDYDVQMQQPPDSPDVFLNPESDVRTVGANGMFMVDGCEPKIDKSKIVLQQLYAHFYKLSSTAKIAKGVAMNDGQMKMVYHEFTDQEVVEYFENIKLLLTATTDNCTDTLLKVIRNFSPQETHEDKTNLQNEITKLQNDAFEYTFNIHAALAHVATHIDAVRECERLGAAEAFEEQKQQLKKLRDDKKNITIAENALTTAKNMHADEIEALKVKIASIEDKCKEKEAVLKRNTEEHKSLQEQLNTKADKIKSISEYLQKKNDIIAEKDAQIKRLQQRVDEAEANATVKKELENARIEIVTLKTENETLSNSIPSYREKFKQSVADIIKAQSAIRVERSKVELLENELAAANAQNESYIEEIKQLKQQLADNSSTITSKTPTATATTTTTTNATTAATTTTTTAVTGAMPMDIQQDATSFCLPPLSPNDCSPGNGNGLFAEDISISSASSTSSPAPSPSFMLAAAAAAAARANSPKEDGECDDGDDDDSALNASDANPTRNKRLRLTQHDPTSSQCIAPADVFWDTATSDVSNMPLAIRNVASPMMHSAVSSPVQSPPLPPPRAQLPTPPPPPIPPTSIWARNNSTAPTTTTTGNNNSRRRRAASFASGQCANDSGDIGAGGIVEQSLGQNLAGNVVGDCMDGCTPKYYFDKNGLERLKYEVMGKTKSKLIQKLTGNSKKLIQKLVPAKYLVVKNWLDENIYSVQKTINLEGPFQFLTLDQCANALVFIMNFCKDMVMSFPIAPISDDNVIFLDYFFDHDVCKVSFFENNVLKPLFTRWVSANTGRIITTKLEQDEVSRAAFALMGNILGFSRQTMGEKCGTSFAPQRKPQKD